MKSDNKNYKFKLNNNDISLSSRDEVKIINIALTQQTVRSIDIISERLDPGVFDSPDFIESVKQLSISNKSSKVRILIKNSEFMTSNGHRMIEIIQLLTSTIEVRKISDDYKSYGEAFTVFDRKGVIYLRHADRYEGIANFNRPRMATELSNFFNEVWEHSVPDANLRRLHL